MGIVGGAARDRRVAVALTIAATIPHADRARVAASVAARSAAEPGLTAREAASLERALADGRLVVAREGDELVGFVLAEPCGPVTEAASLWVRPDRRDASVMLGLIDACEAIAGDRWIVATFDPGFAAYLQRRRGYRRISIVRAIAITRGRLVTQRLGRERRGQVARHLASARPVLLLGERCI